MATFNKFNITVQNFGNGKMNLGSDVLKIALSDTLPVATNQIFTDIVEIAAGNGYSAGGTAVTITSSTQTAGLYKLIGNNVVFTASGGSIAQFRYVVFYDSTPSSPLKPLIGWYDFGSEVNLTNGSTFTVQFDAVNGILQIQ